MSQTYNCNLTQRTTMTKYMEIPKLKKKILRMQQIITKEQVTHIFYYRDQNQW